MKLIFLLLVYFAGFATAIYLLAPQADGQVASGYEDDSGNSRLASEEFVKSFNSGMHKCVDFGKEAACRMCKFLKQRYDERQLQAEG